MAASDFPANPRGAGNIDLYDQPKVKNPNGSVSTVDSSSYGMDGKEVLLPSVTPDGRHLKGGKAVVDEYRKTGRYLGKFDTPATATSYGKQLHDEYAKGRYDVRPAISHAPVVSTREATTRPVARTLSRSRR